MPKKQDENVRIYFSDDFSANEVAEITEAFNKITPTDGIANAQFSCDSFDAQTVQTAFMMVLILVSGGILTGFLNSIGSDLKEKLAQVFRNKKTPFVQFRMSYKNIQIDINANPESEDEWNKIFDTIDKAGKMAINEIENDTNIRGIIINYDVNVDGYWNLEKF